LREESECVLALKTIGEGKILENSGSVWMLKAYFGCLVDYGKKYGVTGFNSVTHFNDKYQTESPSGTKGCYINNLVVVQKAFDSLRPP